MTPGPLVINTASFVGLRINGLTGAIAASLGSILFGVIFSILLYNFFKRHHENKMISHSLKGLKSTSIGLIASASMTILTLSIVKENTLNWISILIFIFSYLLTFKLKNPLIIIVISGLLGYFLY